MYQVLLKRTFFRRFNRTTSENKKALKVSDYSNYEADAVCAFWMCSGASLFVSGASYNQYAVCNVIEISV